MNAIAGDGVLTGAEVERACKAGYDGISDGNTREDLEKDPDMGLREPRYATFALMRAVANNTDNEFVRGMAISVDLLLSPITVPISIIQDLIRDLTRD